mmetsp:Transcript_7362/g.27730  ORF Transcript_7362/g.27730 Transcript_7362/m.27730 type:complete len:296 (-) Transcript_7362:128-1015(-)
MAAKYGNTAPKPAASAAFAASSFQPSMVTVFNTIITDRPKSSKERNPSLGWWSLTQHRSPIDTSQRTPRPFGSQIEPAAVTPALSGQTPVASSVAFVYLVTVWFVTESKLDSCASTHRPVSLPANTIVPDTDATNMNHPRKISASRNNGNAVSVVRISNCPSRKFFIARSGRKHRTARMAMNCDPMVVNSDEAVPSTNRKSNWFHPELRYASGDHSKPWSRILRTASAAKSAVDAFSKPSWPADRPTPPPRMFSLAIDPVFATITANTNTSNQALLATCRAITRTGFVGENTISE